MYDISTDAANPSTSAADEADRAHDDTALPQNTTPQAVPTHKKGPGNATSKKARGKASSVATATRSPTLTQHDKLVHDAMQAAAAINHLLVENTDQTEHQSPDLIRRMLLVRESFEVKGAFDEVTFWQFVDRRCGPVRGKLKNRWQRLAKMCVPKETKRPQVSKYGYVLSALVKRDIRAADVMDAFEDEGAVEPGGRDYTGMERFVQFYKQDTFDPAKPTNPLLTWGKRRLVDHARLVVEALKAQDLLRSRIKDADDILIPFSSAA